MIDTTNIINDDTRDAVYTFRVTKAVADAYEDWSEPVLVRFVKGYEGQGWFEFAHPSIGELEIAAAKKDKRWFDVQDPLKEGI